LSKLVALQPISDSTLRGRCVDQLRDLIVTGDLVPGSRLTETELASALGVSRGPLREAIRELVDIGLVVSAPYKGLFVRKMTRNDLEEIYSLRTALERFAFQICWPQRNEKALLDLHKRRDVLQAAADDPSDRNNAITKELELHSWCYELSGHKLLQQSWRRLRPNLQFYFAVHHKAHARTGPFPLSHDTYVRLASGNNLDAMLEHLDEHMRQGLETTVIFFETS
jgi:DNA-binding GntR family transcriptional regulator